MFKNLVESGSHKKDLARTGSFFLGTLILYALALTAAGVASIYVYNAHLDTLNMAELVRISLDLPPPEARTGPRSGNQAPAAAPGDRRVRMIPTVREILAPPTDPRHVPNSAGVIASSIPIAPPNAVIGERNFIPGGDGPNIPGLSHGSGGSLAGSGPPSVHVAEADAPPPMPTPKPTPARPISLGVINGKAIEKPAPPYPPIARAVRVSGTVTVQIVVDEDGRVLSARAVDGPPLLRAAAQQAALRARFTPTLLSQQPVKVSGFITYNFVLQ